MQRLKRRFFDLPSSAGGKAGPGLAAQYPYTRPIRRDLFRRFLPVLAAQFLFWLLVPLLAQDDECLMCHEEMTRPTPEPPTSAPDLPTLSAVRPELVHGEFSCTDCHEDASAEHSFTPEPLSPVPCGTCHPEVTDEWTATLHGKALNGGTEHEVFCPVCHTGHDVLRLTGLEIAAGLRQLKQLENSCRQCHPEEVEAFQSSVHFAPPGYDGEELPGCTRCHPVHRSKVAGPGRDYASDLPLCSECHISLTETYLTTLHGKAFRLGSTEVAQCQDCHGTHAVLPPEHPRSTLSRANAVKTCQQCHPAANQRFTGYLTHANHHDKERYPSLYYSFLGMNLLLALVFTLAGLHSILWLYRGFRSPNQTSSDLPAALQGRYYERFDRFSVATHFIVMTSFMTLAMTGMTLKFSGVDAFQFLSRLMGGYGTSSIAHRVAAIFTFAYILVHLGYLIRKMRRRRMTVHGMLTGERTVMFRSTDFQEASVATRWFLGLGPPPQYGRWTYWEKFDYLAVFWGVAMIGFSGLVLWFPEFFTGLGMPGQLINIAVILHSDEAMLAVGFIFTIHFFNGHLRPEKFPMDMVIFTGRVPLEHLKKERPREYALILEDEFYRSRLREAPPRWLQITGRMIGSIGLAVGLFILVLILYALLGVE